MGRKDAYRHAARILAPPDGRMQIVRTRRYPR
jgi:hypothetical protein